jgi:hypothetical protein
MELDLTALERSVLEEISQQQPADQRGVLVSQLASARVTRRENTGAGFFTYLAVDRNGPPLTSRWRVAGNVVATIVGFERPILIALFMKDGYASMLEATTSGESTAGIDLSTIRFKINPA